MNSGANIMRTIYITALKRSDVEEGDPDESLPRARLGARMNTSIPAWPSSPGFSRGDAEGLSLS